MTKQLRESYVEDVTAIVKTCLNDNELIQGTNAGWLTIDDICTKYHVCRKTVTDKCRIFKVSRKRVGKHKLVNEAEFLAAADHPTPKPKFLQKVA